jgi:hypothetical protein
MEFLHLGLELIQTVAIIIVASVYVLGESSVDPWEEPAEEPAAAIAGSSSPAPAVTPAAVSPRVAILKDGCVHHVCAIDSPDYLEAYKTPGLVLRHPDGSIVEGRQ